MMYFTPTIFLALTATTFAFPSRMFDMARNEDEKRALQEISAKIEKASLKPRVTPTFSASEQYVSNKGSHAYVAPGKGDLRGPCPGLNAMANHNYLPHNGVATITQFVQGTYDVFGMGLDLGAFLAVFGAVFDGDLTKWSIGGPPTSGLLSVGLLGTPDGLIGSHNKYEGDASPFKPDLYEYGNNYKFITPQFEDLYSRPLGPRGYDLSVLNPFRATRFQQSIDNNPYFFNGPFSGVLVQPAAYTFIYRFMSNKSSTYPDGYLSGEVLKSFYGVTGQPGSFVYNEGQEKIPDNWYKRAIGDEYTIPFFNNDLMDAARQYPQFLNIGGNTGKVNTFTGVDLTSLTKGVFNAQTLAQGNNLFCFASQFAAQATPDLVKNLFTSVTEPLAQINAALGKAIASLGCPQLADIDTAQLEALGKSSQGSY